MYMKNPSEIEKTSFAIIKNAIKKSFSQEEMPVVVRVVHATGDLDYENIIRFTNEPVKAALEVLRCGTKIYVDTSMGLSGINKETLHKLMCDVFTFIHIKEVEEKARKLSITRAMASLDMAVEKGAEIFVIGNAPTALFRLCEHIKTGKTKPNLVIGVPVGFVGAAESKELLRSLDVPSISTFGTKGGSNVAAAIMNALMYMVVKKCM